METLVSTILIIVIFTVSSLILNNMFLSAAKNNTKPIMSELYELEYLYLSGKLDLPYQDDYKEWDISVSLEKQEDLSVVRFSASNASTDKTVELISYKR